MIWCFRQWQSTRWNNDHFRWWTIRSLSAISGLQKVGLFYLRRKRVYWLLVFQHQIVCIAEFSANHSTSVIRDSIFILFSFFACNAALKSSDLCFDSDNRFHIMPRSFPSSSTFELHSTAAVRPHICSSNLKHRLYATSAFLHSNPIPMHPYPWIPVEFGCLTFTSLLSDK